MTGIEWACLAILSLWLGLRFRGERDRRALATRLLCIAAAAWFGEESCIRIYGFYGYATSWQVRLLDVPLAIICIWPVVIQSALDLCRSANPRVRPLLAAGLVVVDASLIEPIATASRLWTWLEPGPFSVPVIGVLGWGFFALGVALVVERRAWWVLLAGPAAAHGLLLATWWGAFRWLPAGEDPRPWVVVAALAATTLGLRWLRRPPPVARRDVMLRAPAAAFFFVLLALYARDDVWLVAWALAFAPPWLVLLRPTPVGGTAAAPAPVPARALRQSCAVVATLALAAGVALAWRESGTVALRSLPAREVAMDEPLADDERALVMVGDVMLGRGVAGRVERDRVPFSTFFDDTRALLIGADLAFANLESPISDRGREKLLPIAFRAPPAAVDALVGAGFDVVSLANNHALDWGDEALEDTRERLRRAGVATVGVGAPERQQEPVIVDARGVRVGILAYCDPRSAGGCSFLDGPFAEKPVRALRATVERDVRALRPQVDVLVVSLHWGTEERAAPDRRQVELGRWLVELGVDVVAGHHPHVQQPAERWGKGVILYSMGNFIFDQHTRPEFMESRLYRVVVARDGVRRAAYLPLRYDKRRWQPRPTDDRLVEITAPLP